MRWLLLAGLLLAPAPALAEGCADRDGIIEQIECARGVLAEEDTRLNEIWPRVMREHPSGGDRDAHRQEIRAAQRAWIVFRDADCEAASKIGIPKYWEMNRLGCLVGHTRARITALTETYLD